MATYAHRCRDCNAEVTTLTRDTGFACVCGGRFRRDFSFHQGKPPMQPHFNYATGEYVNNDREFRDALKRTADRNSESTGVSHSYDPVYPGDMPEPPHREADGILNLREQRIHDGAVAN